jgi:hypothetical protein
MTSTAAWRRRTSSPWGKVEHRNLPLRETKGRPDQLGAVAHP